MTPPASHRVKSFPPQVGEDCRVLVLGTVPSLRSLELRQSYGHAQNLFWTFMGELFDAGRELPYAERIRRLHARGIGIWDVYKQVERPGSLDSSIVKASEVPNAIPRLLERHATIRAIALNGGKAAEGFRRHIEPRLDAGLRARIDVLALPSTSPANASIARAGKFERWSVLRDYAKPAGRIAQDLADREIGKS
ncbi:MAG: DNA-deoxyinosine glycosylase [Rudaea sp.]|uniref:DNA-deoxyinosine glycosylase n=1 Tax=Rudaea sp. TaxID=2136325 RepID=UPI0039E703E5